MSNHLESLEVTAEQHRAFNAAVAVLEVIFDANLYALLFVDSTGAFFHYRSDSELAVARFLASANWKANLRVVEEHLP